MLQRILLRPTNTLDAVYTIMHIPLKLKSEVVEHHCYVNTSWLYVNVSIWEQCHLLREKPKLINCTTEILLTSPKGKMQPGKSYTALPTPESKLWDFRWTCFVLDITKHTCKNTVSLMLLFYGYFVYSKRHLYLKCNQSCRYAEEIDSTAAAPRKTNRVCWFIT